MPMAPEAEVINPEIESGPGGVGTPTPEPGPTPTPQPSDGALAPLDKLLGKDGEAAKVEDKKTEAEPEKKAEETVAETSRSDAEVRINKLTAEKWNERREKEAALARAKLAEETLAEMAKAAGLQQDGEGKTKAKPTNGGRTFTEAELREEIMRATAHGEFSRSADAAVIQGRKDHSDFDVAVAQLKNIAGPVIPSEFVAAAIQTGEASEVIYQLGMNPAEADRIFSLPPIPQAVAVAQFAQEIKSKRGDGSITVSKAPPPIKPKVGGSVSVEKSLEDMPMGEFIKKRNEAEQAARAARRR